MTSCGNCGKPITNRDAKRFCDRKCYMAYRRLHPEEYGKKEKTYSCAFCGKPGIKRKPSELRNKVYCSRECSNKAQSEYLGTHPELRTSKGVPLACATCGETFYVKPHRANKAKYCSKACSWAARFGRPVATYNRTSMKGSKNPNYKGNNNCITARALALSYFGKRCMICGFDAVVRAHHIQWRCNGGTNDLTNLIVLCPNCHAMAHDGLISQDELILLNRAAIAQLSENPRQTRLPPEHQHATCDTEP